MIRITALEGGSPGLVVMGGDPRSEGCGFKSQRCVLDGHFFTLICCKIVLILFEKTDNKRKRGRGLPILKKECHLVGSGCDSVGRAVASDSRGPQFESSHRQTFTSDN